MHDTAWTFTGNLLWLVFGGFPLFLEYIIAGTSDKLIDD